MKSMFRQIYTLFTHTHAPRTHNSKKWAAFTQYKKCTEKTRYVRSWPDAYKYHVTKYMVMTYMSLRKFLTFGNVTSFEQIWRY